jgi:hypothetical protein
MNGGGAGCGVAGGEGRGGSCAGHCALTRSSVEGRGNDAGSRGGGGAIGQVGSRRRRWEVEDDADEWDRGVGDWERGRGRGGAGRL